MELKEYIGKVIRVKIIKKLEKCYIAKELNTEIIVYIKDEEYYEETELVGSIEKCIILDEIEGKLIGFLITNKKFVYDINKINSNLKNKEEYLKINDIYLMERLKINGKIQGLYLVDEGEIGKYYLDTTEIGIYNKKIIENNILFKEKTIEDELKKQIKDVVQSIDLNKKEISLRKEQEKQKNIIERALGIEGINRIATIDLKQKIEEKDKQKDNKFEIDKFKSFENKKENNIKDVNIKQEMDTHNKITDMKTIGQVLEKYGKLPENDGKKYTKLGIIETDEKSNLVNEKGENLDKNTTRYAFVAIANDGSVVPLNLEQDHQEGNNPREINYQVTQQGEVKQNDVISRYKLGDGTLAIDNGKYGEIKAYHSPRKTIGGKGVEGNKSLDRELETNQVWDMKKEERDLAEEFGDGYRSVEEGYQEAKSHEDDQGRIIDDDKMKTRDIDGDINTRSHAHDRVDYNKLAVKWGYYRDGEPNYDRAKELFEEKRKENPNKDTKEIIEMVSEDLEEEIGGTRERR